LSNWTAPIHVKQVKTKKANKTKGATSSLNAMPNTPQNNTTSSGSLHTMFSSKQGTKTKNQATKSTVSLSLLLPICEQQLKVVYTTEHQNNSQTTQAKGLAKTPVSFPSNNGNQPSCRAIPSLKLAVDSVVVIMPRQR